MSDTRAYVRVYHSIIDDPKFATVYDDCEALACWLRLLIVADQAWPASGFLPMSTSPTALERLVSAQIVDRMPGDRFRIHGLDTERNARGGKASAAAAMRWHSVRNANAQPEQLIDSATVMPSLAEPSKAEPSIPAHEGLPNLSPDVAKAWEEATGRSVLASGAYAQSYLDDACRRHEKYDVIVKIRRARASFPHIPDAAQMVAAMRPLLDPLPDRKAVRAVDSEAAQLDAGRRRSEATLARTHALGAHADSPHPRCPECRKAGAA